MSLLHIIFSKACFMQCSLRCCPNNSETSPGAAESMDHAMAQSVQAFFLEVDVAVMPCEPATRVSVDVVLETVTWQARSSRPKMLHNFLRIF